MAQAGISLTASVNEFARRRLVLGSARAALPNLFEHLRRASMLNRVSWIFPVCITLCTVCFRGEKVEFPGDIGRALDVAEFSEWFDWMRREVSLGGIELPHEETAVSFAGHALRLRDRVRTVYRHLPISLEDRLVKSAIIYQCWELQSKLREKSKWPDATSARNLVAVEAVRYIRPEGNEWGYHVVEASDGFNYTITVASGFCNETTPATQVICNRLAKLLGLRVPDVKVVTVGAAFLRRANDIRPGRAHRDLRRSPELCAGFRRVDSAPSSVSEHERPPLTARNLRDLMGALVLDIWTLNMSPRGWSAAFTEATGRTECTLLDDSGGLSGGDWGRFLGSNHQTLSAVQAAAVRVKKWQQLEPWLQKACNVDLNPIWELAFLMPTIWHGGQRQILANVLGRLGQRQWDLHRAVDYFMQTGYLAAVKVPPSRSGPGTEACSGVSQRSA
jgi:hypothetical protein